MTICTDEDFSPESKSSDHPRTISCFPAMSNFNGRKYPLSWIQTLQSSSHLVLLDAASFMSTNQLNLSTAKPDFVVISFYKMFGYPTGLGALLVRNASSAVLDRRDYFGGGTVDIALVRKSETYRRSNISQKFEDGTIDFLGKGFHQKKNLQI